MKATDLRIGNYLLDREIRLCMVEELSEDEIYAPAINGPVTARPHNPIPLTEDWLKRLGCQESKNNEGVYFLNHLGWCCEFDGEDWAVRQKFEDESIVAYCRYVHQMQNLYYALTGEELYVL